MRRLWWVIRALIALYTGSSFIAPLYADEIPEVRALRHNLQVELNPRQGLLQVQDRIEIVSGGNLRFRLADEVELLEVRLDGEPISIKGNSGFWQMDLGKFGPHELELRYSGTFLPEGESETLTPVSPQRPVITPGASYLPPGSGWYPEFESTSFTYAVSVSVPAPQKALVPGRLIMETHDHEGAHCYQARFDFSEPAWGIPLFAGPYQIREHRNGAYRLRTYFFEGMDALADDYLSLSNDYINLFADRIGPYPFNSFHIVAAQRPLGLGFPGITYIGRRVLALPFIKHSSLGHEILHNWWGNGVYVDYAKGNWAEGLTTYLADYFLLERKSIEKAKERRLEWLRDYAALPAERDLPARAFTSKTHTASQVVGYNKVAFLFHMLRRELGEDIFDTALRRYWNKQRFHVAGWDELENSFSATADRDLSVYFSQWLDRAGAPNISLNKVVKKRNADRRWDLSLVVTQTEPAYRLQLPIRIQTRDGAVERIVQVNGPRTAVTVQLASEPLELAADPDFHLFRHLEAGEAPPILRDTLLSGQTQSLLLGNDAFRQQALGLANAMLDAPLQLNSSLDPNKPFLLIGPSAEVEAFLDAHNIPGVPAELMTPSSARAWAGHTQKGQPYVIVAADNQASLAALLRPLPHYGRRGYLAFQGSKAIVKGNWPMGASGIRYRVPQNSKNLNGVEP